MPRIAGYLFFAAVLGVVALPGPLADIARAGFFNAVEPHFNRSAALAIPIGIHIEAANHRESRA